jgi:cytoskeletal protein RodZ
LTFTNGAAMADDTNISEQKKSARSSTDYKRLQRKKKRKIMKIKLEVAFFSLIAIVILLIVGIMYASGFFYKKADTSTLILNSDKSIIFEEIEKNDELSSKKELSSYIKGIVKEYNSENGSDLVKVQDISVKNNKAYVRIKYKDYKTYADFTGHDVYSGTVKNALKKGYDFETSFYPVKSGKFGASVESDKITSSKKNKVLIVPEAVNIRVDGKKIKYVSTDGTKYVSEDEIGVEASGDTEPTVYVIY